MFMVLIAQIPQDTTQLTNCPTLWSTCDEKYSLPSTLQLQWHLMLLFVNITVLRYATCTPPPGMPPSPRPQKFIIWFLTFKVKTRFLFKLANLEERQPIFGHLPLKAALNRSILGAPPEWKYGYDLSSSTVADLDSKILDAHPPSPPPLESKFFQFHAVLGKFGKIVCWRPLKGWYLHLDGILDPPLIYQTKLFKKSFQVTNIFFEKMSISRG